MKITKMESFFVKPRWHFLKISTDEGICGWGEPIVEGRARTVAMAVKELEPVLIGQNPLETERIWTETYRGTFYRGGPILVSALSGIDQALWDIKGKYHDTPVYKLLGGPTRKRARKRKPGAKRIGWTPPSRQRGKNWRTAACWRWTWTPP